MEGFSRYEIEDMILGMAEIVHENRQLRAEVYRLQEVEKEYHNYVNEQYKAGQRAIADIFKTALSSCK